MKKSSDALKETDLYLPLKEWLERNGYTVRSEVLACDIAAARNDELVLIEIKRRINLELLMQVTRRQSAHASVYAAVPAPRTIDRRWRELTRLLKRLECGLVLVYLESKLQRVEVAFHPLPQVRRRDSGQTRALLAEMSGRTLDMNMGGSSRCAIMTAYREQAIHVAAILATLGKASPKMVRGAGGPDKAGTILLRNHYGWFERVETGSYILTCEGRATVERHRGLVEKLLEA